MGIHVYSSSIAPSQMAHMTKEWLVENISFNMWLPSSKLNFLDYYITELEQPMASKYQVVESCHLECVCKFVFENILFFSIGYLCFSFMVCSQLPAAP